jgi:hypothetical protein
MEIVGLLIVFILALVALAKISKLERDVARLSAMLLKARYLSGEAVEKEAFRALAVSGEERMGEGSPVAMSPVARG